MIEMEVDAMLINEVCKECSLTKKAIEYYEAQQLVQPQLSENGYRHFAASEVEKLKKIAVLRKLGLSVPEIRPILEQKGIAPLRNVLAKKSLEMEVMKAKQALAEQLAQDADWDSARLQLEVLEQKQTVTERLLGAFPGYYGKYMALHFAQYLGEPIATSEQQAAFETIVGFLDGMDLQIPADLQAYLDEITIGFDASVVAIVTASINSAVCNPEKYIAENQETLEQYLAFKQTDEYKQSPAYRLQALFAAFNRESGYNDIFIPAMQRLSPSYREYHAALQKANEVFIKIYPEAAPQP